MGTKIQANTFFREYHSVIDLDGSTSNGMRYPDSFKSYGSEKVRQTILEHESVFRHQLQELHRLYRRQQELMSEVKRRQANNTEKPQLSKSSIFPNRASYDGDAKLSLGPLDLHSKRTDYRGDLRIANPTDGIRDSLTISKCEVSANPHSNNFNPVTRDFFRSSIDGMNAAISLCSNDFSDVRRFGKHSSVGGFCPSKPVAFPPRNELLNCPLDIGTPVSQGRKKIFGVVISDGNENKIHAAASNMSSTSNQKVRPQQGNHRVVSFEPSSWIANSLVLGGVNDGKNGIKGLHDQCAESGPIKYFKNLEDVNSKPGDILKKNNNSCNEVPNGGLPWFLRNSKVSDDDQSKPKKSSYFMNLDSLQNCSQEFFKKAEIAEGAFQDSKQKKELLSLISDQNAECGTNEAINGTNAKGFPISDVLSFKNRNYEDNGAKLETDNPVSRQGSSNNYVAELKHHIDLNLSLDEDDAPSALSIPTAIVKIASTEIDLEAPAVTSSETDGSHNEVHTSTMDVPPGNCKLSYEECDKIAAEAILAISLSDEAESGNSLEWFAEIVSSQFTDEEESIPDGMDYFEFMTLKLKDTKEEHYCNEPFLLNNLSDDDDETKATLSRRSRRGQSRRGRQRKDFQRDVLPGLVTLSRLQVTEDFQTFEELLKGEGATSQLRLSQRSSVRNGRGRKRLGGSSNTSLICSRTEQPVCQLEETSLTGWGKRTRRLPRQRCTNAILSLPVKC